MSCNLYAKKYFFFLYSKLSVEVFCSPHMLLYLHCKEMVLNADPDRIKKDREREERVRLARERLEEERKKKLVELQEQQRQAQENREKQLEMRRQKIEDLRRRDIERRAAVEERRRAKEDADRVSAVFKFLVTSMVIVKLKHLYVACASGRITALLDKAVDFFT